MGEQTINVGSMSDDELRNLIDEMVAQVERRKAITAGPPATLTVSLSTSYFDCKKHGHAYVAIMKMGSGGKVEREFIDGGSRRWDGKRKYYSQDWEFEAKLGTVIECRLNDGSWKNDRKEWYVIESDGKKDITQDKAHKLLKGAS